MEGGLIDKGRKKGTCAIRAHLAGTDTGTRIGYVSDTWIRNFSENTNTRIRLEYFNNKKIDRIGGLV
jgi:hypothetical protein